VRAIAIATLFALTAGLGPAAIALAPKAASPVAIVAAPWAAAGEAARIVAAADGSIMAATGDGHVAIARSGAQDFVARLYRAGALIVLDAALVAACLPVNRIPTGAPT
jgi:TctA family transporter